MPKKNIKEIENAIKGNDELQSKEPYKLDITSLAEFKAMELPNSDFLVSQFIPEVGISMVHGAPGAYKTFLVLQMIADISNEDKFLGIYETKKAKILIINLDDIPVQLQQRFNFLKTNNDAEKDVYMTYANEAYFDVNVKDHLEIMIEKAKKLKVGLIVIDTLRQCHKTRENESDDMNKTMNNLKKLSKTTGYAIIFCHHNAKSTFGLSGALQASGSHVIAGSCVSSIGLKTKESGIITMDQGKSKLCERLKTKITLKFSSQSYPLFSITDSPIEKATDDDAREAIKALYTEDATPGHTMTDLINQYHSKWKMPKAVMKRAFKSLINDKYLSLVTDKNSGSINNKKVYQLSQTKEDQDTPTSTE